MRLGRTRCSAKVSAPIAALLVVTAALSCAGREAPRSDTGPIPVGFVSLREADPTIELDIRYFGANNFVGRPVNGYDGAACILTVQAAAALARVQHGARVHGYSLKVYDCYRPRRAVADFVAWAENTGETTTKHRFYPAVAKQELFARGYIAAKSGHSRGSTLDLTLVPLGSRQPSAPPGFDRYDCRAAAAARYPDNSIDMGTGFDCFDELAHTDNSRLTGVARRNRDLLRALMTSAGFVNLPEEWWHYTLAKEPFPDTYFDFPVDAVLPR